MKQSPPPHRVIASSEATKQSLATACHCEERSDEAIPPPPCHCEQRSDEAISFACRFSARKRHIRRTFLKNPPKSLDISGADI